MEQLYFYNPFLHYPQHHHAINSNNGPICAILIVIIIVILCVLCYLFCSDRNRLNFLNKNNFTSQRAQQDYDTFMKLKDKAPFTAVKANMPNMDAAMYNGVYPHYKRGDLTADHFE